MEGGGLSLLRNKALGGIKRIKISRACDECRKRKVKQLVVVQLLSVKTSF